MNKYIVALALAATLLSTACTVVQPEPGEEGVLIDRPIVFGKGGVRPDTVKGGQREMTWFSTQKVYVVTSPTTINLALNDFSSQDNILLDFETSVQYQITEPAKIVNFGEKWFDNNIRAGYASIVRDAVKKHTMSDMMSNPATASSVDAEVTKGVEALIKEEGIPVRVVNVSLGRAHPNPEVLAQMNKTAAEQQRLKTLVASTAAENQREQEQRAKAKADSAYREDMQQTVNQQVAIKLAEIQRDACAQAKSCVLVPAGTSVIVQ